FSSNFSTIEEKKDGRCILVTRKPLHLLVNLLFLTAFLLVTFFGIGPVLLADGSMQERLFTLLLVLLILTGLLLLFRYVKSRIP
ncbi:DUF6954 family protein, partial [Proteiniclasticum sp.]|uniref:DUF6954 family protein n=1 Tax=Proteiniclasticum sp. TaxID=2053595 RepID=UPI002896556D